MQMKLVIDINENEYIGIKSMEKDTTSYPWTIHLYDAVKTATPLEKVLEEITGEIEENLITDGQVIEGEFFADDAENINYGLNVALKIIDSHISGKERKNNVIR